MVFSCLKALFLKKLGTNCSKRGPKALSFVNKIVLPLFYLKYFESGSSNYQG